ncbi:LONGIFOLIA PROTEIN [Salix purpurea]|uniref:LONGIFOLIA PROTEIN n=1 Tax=Salix purpurea TaxID=77065 RepID=A0A9Q0VIT8_SALPP|nr:LONGIFOLIA PROTEIN [Salix purpurea]
MTNLNQISNESRTSTHQGDGISLQSDGTVSDLKTDIDVTSTQRSTENYGDLSPTLNANRSLVSGSLQKKTTLRFEEDRTSRELLVAPEHLSPVSVLDALVYRDDALSPGKQIPNILKGPTLSFQYTEYVVATGTEQSINNEQFCSHFILSIFQDSSHLKGFHIAGKGAKDSHDQQSEYQCNLADNFLSNSVTSGLSSEINHRRLRKIENLVQKLRRLNSTHNEASTDYIASLCENPKSRPQIHFGDFVGFWSSTQRPWLWPDNISTPPIRKLIFDAVNEILVKKLASMGPSPEPWLKSDKLAKKALSPQKLLNELCSDMGQLQIKKSECSLEDGEDGLKSFLWDDVMHRAESWVDFHSDISGTVLDVERLVFKDLVDEIVIG